MRRCFLPLLLLLNMNATAQAEGQAEPTPDCRLRNAALCQIGETQFPHDGPCPTDATTLRPPGKEDCNAAIPRERPSERPERPERLAHEEHPATTAVSVQTEPTALPAHTTWQLPALLFATLLTVLSLAAWLLHRLLRFSRERTTPIMLRDLGSAIAGTIGGFWLAFQGAGWAFGKAYNYFLANAAESTSMLGALVGLITFCLLLPIAGTLLTLVLLKLQDFLTRR